MDTNVHRADDSGASGQSNLSFAAIAATVVKTGSASLAGIAGPLLPDPAPVGRPKSGRDSMKTFEYPYFWTMARGNGHQRALRPSGSLRYPERTDAMKADMQKKIAEMGRARQVWETLLVCGGGAS